MVRKGPLGVWSRKHGWGDREFYPRDRVVAFLLLGPVPLFEEGRLVHPHPHVRNEIKIVPDWRRLGHVALSLTSLHSSWSSLCREDLVHWGVS